MINEEIAIRKHLRNIKATRIISFVLCIEQAVYGLLIAENNSELQTLYFVSAAVIGFLFVFSSVIPVLLKNKTSLVYSLLDILPLGIGMGIAYVRMISVSTSFFNIPTVYLAILYGGSVIFLLSYLQSALLYGIILCISIFSVGRIIPTDPSIPFAADFLINGAIAWAVSAVTYNRFLRTENQRLLIEVQNKQLTYISEHDWLTGLYNRRKLDRYLLNKDSFTSAILFDLDHFKTINDTYGHQKGDQVLKELADLAQSLVLPDEVVGRWGGEEFLILTHREGFAFAQSLREVIAAYQFAKGITITASFGVAKCNQHQSVQALISTIDQNLYTAKLQGRNRVVYT